MGLVFDWFCCCADQSQASARASYKLEGRDIVFEIIVGDIWAMQGEVVISAPTTFDTDRSLISSDSLQGQFTDICYTSPDHLAYDLKNQLQGVQGLAINRAGQELVDYPVGTVVRVNTRKRAAYLGTPEKVKSTAAQLVSVIESR